MNGSYLVNTKGSIIVHIAYTTCICTHGSHTSCAGHECRDQSKSEQPLESPEAGRSDSIELTLTPPICAETVTNLR